MRVEAGRVMRRRLILTALTRSPRVTTAVEYSAPLKAVTKGSSGGSASRGRRKQPLSSAARSSAETGANSRFNIKSTRFLIG